MDSLPSKSGEWLAVQRKDVLFQCQKHGEITVTLSKVYGEWPTPSCPICQAEAEDWKGALKEHVDSLPNKAGDKSREKDALVQTEAEKQKAPSEEQIDSLSTKLPDEQGIQRKEVPFQCHEHGQVKAVLFKLYCDWSTPSCPTCRAEEEEQKAALEEQKQQKDKQARTDARLKNCLIPPRFQGKGFSSYTPASIMAAKHLAACRDYAENFPTYAAKGTSLILCGLTGTGKTHLACAIARHIIIEQGKSAIYHQVSIAMRLVKETYQKGSKRTEQEAINAFITPDLLVLDEIGVQHGTDTERNILFEIVNSRYEQMKPTILISNLAPAGLVDYAGERTVDRMRENGGIMRVFNWESYRGTRILKENSR